MVVETSVRGKGKWLVKCKKDNTIFKLYDLVDEGLTIQKELMSQLFEKSDGVVRSYEQFGEIVTPCGRNYLGYSLITVTGEVRGKKFCVILVANGRGDFEVVASTEGDRTLETLHEALRTPDSRIVLST